IRQHGVELLTDLTPYVELKNGQTELTARAVETNRPGYYTATLNVPKSGDWAATIQTSFGKSRLKLMPIAALDPGSRRMVSFTAQQRGERLFVAKGCMSCHEHAQVPESGEYKVGPVLTKRRFEQGYLRRFLADPSIKPPTVDARMPNLGLSEADIASLVAFLNGDPDMRAASGGF
ncbi:MAG TPA: cytochrome c, partial [Steroidobacteraceae bacterium]